MPGQGVLAAAGGGTTTMGGGVGPATVAVAVAVAVTVTGDGLGVFRGAGGFLGGFEAGTGAVAVAVTVAVATLGVGAGAAASSDWPQADSKTANDSIPTIFNTTPSVARNHARVGRAASAGSGNSVSTSLQGKDVARSAWPNRCTRRRVAPAELRKNASCGYASGVAGTS